MLSPDMTYHLLGRHMGGGTLHGLAALMARLGAAVEALDGPPKSDLLSVYGYAPFAFTGERFQGRRADTSLDQTVCTIWRFEHDLCVEVWSHFADQEACDRFLQGVVL
jgi:hypothetical protein